MSISKDIAESLGSTVSTCAEPDEKCVATTSFCVVLHDVAAPFQSEIRKVVDGIRPIIGSRFSAAIVPCWDGREDPSGLQAAIDICGECNEWMLHGLTHQRQRGRGLVSCLTGGLDEFSGLNAVEIQERLHRASRLIQQSTGSVPGGLVAPCWQLPVSASQLSGLQYVMGYHQLECCDGKSPALPLATWSYDWGRIRRLTSAANLLPRIRSAMKPEVIPCVVIHPADVRRGDLGKAIRQISDFVQRGRTPLVPRQLLDIEKSGRS